MQFIENKFLAAFLLIVFSFSLYAFSLNHGFVWDDKIVIKNSNEVFSAHGFFSHFSPKLKEKTSKKYWRPVHYLSYVLDKGLWGDKAFGYHLTNGILNSITVVLLFIFGFLIFESFSIKNATLAAFAGSLLFAFHPMHTESVSWISGRTDVLATLFFLVAFIFHIKLRKPGVGLFAAYTILSGLGFSLAILSKEVALTFPFVVLVYDIFAKRLSSPRFFIVYSLYLILMLIYFYFREINIVSAPVISGIGVASSPLAEGSTKDFGGLQSLAKVLFNSYLFYIQKMVFPFSFSAFISKVPQPPLYFAAALITSGLIVAGFIWAVVKKRFVIAFCIAWVLLTLGPSVLIAVFHLSLARISQAPLAERYVYLPSAGFCLLLSYLFVNAPTAPYLRRVGLGALVAVSVLFIAFSIDRQRDWANSMTMWESTLETSTDHFLPFKNMGIALMDSGNVEEGLDYFAKGLSIEDADKARAMALNKAGLKYLEQGNLSEAEKEFVNAERVDGTYADSYFNLADTYFQRGLLTGSADYYKKAEQQLSTALKIDGYAGRVHVLLARVYFRLGRLEDAKEQVKLARLQSLKQDDRRLSDELMSEILRHQSDR